MPKHRIAAVAQCFVLFASTCEVADGDRAVDSVAPETAASDEAGQGASDLLGSGGPSDPAAALFDDLPLDGGLAAPVGTLKGQFKVSDDGVATYLMPLATPVGHASVQPKLELRYASSGSDGLLGTGFALGGLSSISRCARTPIPDGRRAPVMLDSSDALCLDGARLVLVEGAHFSLGAHYRTETESFVRVRLVLGPGGDPTFVADHPSGRRILYGATASSRQMTRGVTSGWSLSRIEDAFENFVEVEYESSTSDVVADGAGPAASTIDHRPSRILMWGHGAVPAKLAVRFEYEQRPDPIEGYTLGGIRRTSHRLQALRLHDPSGENFRTYRFGYDIGAVGHSRLTSVMACAGTGDNCMPATRFEYSDTPVEFAVDPTDDFGFAGFDWPNPNRGDHRISAVNVNGDLYDDLVFRSDDTETWHIWQGGPGGSAIDSEIASPENPEFEWFPTRFRGMVDNDAFEDLVVVDAHLDQPLESLTVLRGGEFAGIAGFGAAKHSFGPDSQLDAPMIWDGTWIPQMTAADFNADGLLDFAICHGTEESSTWTIYESGASTPGGWARNETGTTGSCDTDEFIVVDVDGDQAANLVRLADPVSTLDDNYVALIQGTDGTWSEVDTGLPRDLLQRVIDDSGSTTGRRRGQGSDLIVDLNADGLRDVVRIEPPGGPGFAALEEAGASEGGFVVSYLNTGRGFRRGPVLWPTQDEDDEVPYSRFLAAVAMDVDLDGGTDVVIDVVEGEVHRALGVRVLDEPGVLAPFSIEIPALANAGQVLGPFDFNSDGLADMLAQQAWVPELPNEGIVEPVIRVGPRPDLLTRITDGYGATSEIDYVPLRTIHDRDDDCEDDLDGMVECINDTRPVVRFETHDTGTEDASGNVVHRTIEHAYRDGRRHRLGRGWLGFAEHSYSATDDKAPDVLTRVQMDNRTFDDEVRAFPFAHRHSRVTRDTEEVDGRRHVVDDEIELVVQAGPGGDTWFPAREWMRSRHFEIETIPGSCDPHQDCAVDLDDLSVAAPARRTEIEQAYDDYGNVTKATTTRLGGSTSIIAKDYDNNDERWLLGMMVARTESSIAGGKTATRRSTFSYDPNTGALEKSTVAPGHPTYELHTALVRDDYGNVAISTTTNASQVWAQQNLPQPAPRVVTMQYDALGVFPEEVTNALDHATWFVHSYRHGGARRTVDANGVVLDVAYDGLGRRLRSERRVGIGGPSSGVVAHMAYERMDGGEPTSASRLRLVEETPGHQYLESEFDRHQRPVKRTWIGFDGDSITQRERYTPAGLLAETELPHHAGVPAAGRRTVSYDELGRARVETAPDGSETITSYPTAFEHTVEDPAGRVTRFVHDVEDQVVWSADPAGTPTCYTFGPFGVTTEVRRGCSTTASLWTTAGYDSYGRRTSSEDPNQGKRTFDYDGFGLLVRMIAADGKASVYRYDAIGRTTRRQDTDGNTTWTWDTDAEGGFVGLLRSSTSPTGVANHYDYDAFGRLEQHRRTVGATNLVASYDHDAFGREDHVEMPSAFGEPLVLERGYDDWGNLVWVMNATTEQLLWARTEQHPAGMTEVEHFGNGLVTSRAYDPLTLRPESIVTSDAENEFEVQGLVYAFNADGTLKSRGDAVGGQSEQFRYDALGRLTRSTATKGAAQRIVSQSYDAFSNITSRSDVGGYTYGDTKRPDRVTALDGSAVTHDLNGNLRTHGALLSIEYNAFDVPRRVTAGGVVTNHIYDAEGERAQRTSSADNSTTNYLGDYQVKRWGLQVTREHRYAVRAAGHSR